MGLSNHASIVHIVDFGLSKAFRDPKMHIHIPHTTGHGTVGSLLFTSINSHIGSELSRQDNIKSLTYVLIFFLCGSLPWQYNEITSNLVLESKQTTSPHELCHNLPTKILTFLKYSWRLSFDERPDYDYLYSILQGLLIKRGLTDDFTFDWNLNTDIVTNVNASLGEDFKGGPTTWRHKGSNYGAIRRTGWACTTHGLSYTDILLDSLRSQSQNHIIMPSSKSIPVTTCWSKTATPVYLSFILYFVVCHDYMDLDSVHQFLLAL